MLYLYVDKKGGVIRWPATGREDNLCCATFYDNAVWKKEGIELNASRCPHTDTSRSLYVPLSKNNSVVFPIVRTVICISIYAIKAVLFLLCDDWSCGQWDVSKPFYSCCVMTGRVDSEMYQSRSVPSTGLDGTDLWWNECPPFLLARPGSE